MPTRRAAVGQGALRTLEDPTFTAGLRRNGLVAPFVLDGPMNGEAFPVTVEKALVPTLQPDEIVAMDNLPAHKVEGVGKLIADAGAELRLPPAYSPDLNPIEMAFAQLKSHLRKAAERTVPALWDRIGQCLDEITPTSLRQLFRRGRLCAIVSGQCSSGSLQ